MEFDRDSDLIDGKACIIDKYISFFSYFFTQSFNINLKLKSQFSFERYR